MSTNTPLKLNYFALFDIPREYRNKQGAICKFCKYKSLYDQNCKRNLKKHYGNKHPKELADQLKIQSEELTSKPKGQATIQITPECVKTNSPLFQNQRQVETAIAELLCCQGGLPLTIPEQAYSRKFMPVCQPKFQNITYRTVMKKSLKLVIV